ncbi:MAG: cysteine desulfurase family protein [Peptococcaceae bacterium]|jgi:cysteine desulfurase|nr:cysteine desulfurase family protein [Peptococcaceae bacterium]
MIYLDFNATTPVAPEAVAAMSTFWSGDFYNPSAPYPEATTARAAVEDARAALAALLGSTPDTVVWTGGGTESDNWALRGWWASRPGGRRRLLISAVEHPAVAETAAALRAEGAQVAALPVDDRGVVRLDALEEALDVSTGLVSVMLANNETGTIQPVAEIARLAHAAGALVHTDAAQAVGKIEVAVGDLGVDLLTVAGHKFYGPKGIGALYIRPGLELPPLLAGGGQERGRRSGTENVPAVAGLGMAARLARTWLDSGGPDRQARLRDDLEKRLRETVPGCRIFGRSAPRLPNTLALAVPGRQGAALLAACPGIRAGTGSACHHPDDTGSPTLRAMGVAPDWARGLVRLSLGRGTTAADIEAAAGILRRAALRSD